MAIVPRTVHHPAPNPALDRIALLTDFGAGPYVGQVRLCLAGLVPAVPVVSLIADLPPWQPGLAAYLLPGLLAGMPARTLYVCVVDPGVGSARAVLAARVGADWLLAPDNGLLLPLLRRTAAPVVWRVDWRPDRLSASFHGRDLFAPLAAKLLGGALPAAVPVAIEGLVGADWPAQRGAVCYIDHYGNLITGLDAAGRDPGARLTVAPTLVAAVGDAGGEGVPVIGATTFSDVPVGTAFWYANAFGLVEIAVNQGRASDLLGVGLGAPVLLC